MQPRIARSLLLLLSSAPWGAGASVQAPRDLVQTLGRLEHLTLFDLACDRRLDSSLPQTVDRLARQWSTKQVRAMLRLDDAKARALALVILERQLGKQALSTVVELLDDMGQAPPMRMTRLGTLPGEARYELRKQTVSEVAQCIVSGYLSSMLTERHRDGSGMIGPSVLRKAFADYLRTRHGRRYSLIALRRQMQRADGGISPTPAARLPGLLAVRRAIDAVPAPERHWYLLSLTSDWSRAGRSNLATTEERLAAARALGADALLRLLSGFGPADHIDRVTKAGKRTRIDSELSAHRQSAFAWEPIVRFVLAHGGALFPRERAEDFVRIAEKHLRNPAGRIGVGRAPVIVAGWFATAAQLQPSRAAEHIARGFEVVRPSTSHAGERGQLALAAFRLLGDAGKRRAVEWFYGEKRTLEFGPELARPEHAGLLWGLILDRRFADLPAKQVRELARACNAHARGRHRFRVSDTGSVTHPSGG